MQATEHSEVNYQPPDTNGRAGLPLAETAARISALAGHLNSQVGIPHGANWFRLSELADPELMAGWHQEVCKHVGERRVAAAFMSNWLFAYLAGGLLMPVLAERRLALSGHANLAVRRTAGGWFDGLATDDPSIAVLSTDPDRSHPTATTVSSAGELFDLLAERIAGLEPVIGALRAALPIGIPALWGAVSDALAVQAMFLADLMGRDRQQFWDDSAAIVRRLATLQPSMKTAPRPFSVEHDGRHHVFEVRGTCCMNYRTFEHQVRREEGYCTNCPLHPDDARRQIILESLQDQAAS